ncbi:MAG: 1-deoxy-D-xylulose-5-phosphate reductoisomerase [Bacillota bacterium]
MKRLAVLGSTGSIGVQTLNVVDNLENEWDIIALSANTNIDLLEKQARKYKPDYVVIMHENLQKELKYRLKEQDVDVLCGVEGLEFVSGDIEVDIVVNALVGAAGLKPTMAALRSGNKLALANKESLVIGGEIINKYRKEKDITILPIDSEHNAIFQILEGHHTEEICNILLTASGGPFRKYSYEQLKGVTVEQALDHPNWDMGGKITIDSATMMNKGLEVIEAHWLFNIPYDKINVVVHPESIVHSMVEFVDSSIMAEMGAADMRIPIQYVLTYPERKDRRNNKLDLFEVGQLNFQKPDIVKFPSLNLAYQAGKMGGSMPAVLNAANEIAVSAFLKNKISFLDIPYVIEKVMDVHENIINPSLDELYQIDFWARKAAEEVMLFDVNNN